jgi:hypothetical protein
MTTTLAARRSAAISIAALLAANSVASALPVFSGSYYDSATLVGSFDPSFEGDNGNAIISNSGLGVASAHYRTQTNADIGVHGISWSPNAGVGIRNPLSLDANGDSYGQTLAVNDAGVIVGESTLYQNGVSKGTRAIRYGAGIGTPTQLMPLSSSNTGFATARADAVDAGGVSVGQASKYNAAGVVALGSRAVKWNANSTTAIELPIFATSVNNSGYGTGEAVAINDSGIAVGHLETYSNNVLKGFRPMRWKSDGSFAMLDNLGTSDVGDTSAKATGINATGTTIGYAAKFDADEGYVGFRAVRWAPNSSAVTELGVLGGTAVDGETYSDAYAVSNAGLIVGSSRKYLLGTQIGSRATYWSTTGSAAATELPNLGTSASITDGEARAVNNSGAIVGWMEKYSSNVFQGDRAVLWNTVGVDTITDLNTLLPANSGWTLTEARGLSDTGFVSGLGNFDPDGPGGVALQIRLFSMLVPQAGTYGKGDANFDAATNFADLVVLAQHYGETHIGGDIYVADFNLDGITNFTDLVTLAQNYGTGISLVNDPGTGDFATDWTLAQSFVPEPGAIAFLGAAWSLGFRRRSKARYGRNVR